MHDLVGIRGWVSTVNSNRPCLFLTIPFRCGFPALRSGILFRQPTMSYVQELAYRDQHQGQDPSIRVFISFFSGGGKENESKVLPYFSYRTILEYLLIILC